MTNKKVSAKYLKSVQKIIVRLDKAVHTKLSLSLI